MILAIAEFVYYRRHIYCSRWFVFEGFSEGASLLFDGFGIRDGGELTIEDGVVRRGRRAGSYDLVLECSTVIPGLVDGHLHLIHE